MAINTGLILENVCLDVKGTNLGRFMGVTVRAGIFVVPLAAAGLALIFTLLAMIQGESVDAQMSR